MPLVVHLRSAVCLLGRFPALAGVDLDVAEGEILLLSGPNGAGKTTLLRLLAGLHSLHSGHATVLGHDLAVDRGSARGSIGLLGHETRCYDDLTVRENLGFAAGAGGRTPASADRVIEQVGLTAQAGVEHGRLSAGQRRRLALAVALARDPQLLLLDEPHAGLDAEGRAVLESVIRAAPSEGRTVLLASHELDRSRALADREAVLAGGLVVRGGQLPAAPTDDFGAAKAGLSSDRGAKIGAVQQEEVRAR